MKSKKYTITPTELNTETYIRNASNTYTNTVHPVSVGFHVEKDTLGSRQITSK
jgi:hypothetical protein